MRMDVGSPSSLYIVYYMTMYVGSILYIRYCMVRFVGSPASGTLSTLARLQLFWLLTSSASSRPDIEHIISVKHQRCYQANLPNVDKIKVAY